MKAYFSILNLLIFAQYVLSRDFYMGMFKRNDFLVAQDVVYKEANHFGYAVASYGRLFKCPITYFRIVDRLGMGRGPYTTVVRGGLRQKYIAVRIKSTYRLPISVNIYVGCENKSPSTIRRHTTTIKPHVEETTAGAGDADVENETIDDSNSSDSGANATTEEGG